MVSIRKGSGLSVDQPLVGGKDCLVFVASVPAYETKQQVPLYAIIDFVYKKIRSRG